MSTVKKVDGNSLESIKHKRLFETSREAAVLFPPNWKSPFHSASTRCRGCEWDCFSVTLCRHRTIPHTVTKETQATLMFGRQFKVPTSAEFQPQAPQYSDNFLTTSLNNLRTAYTLIRKMNKAEKDRQKVRIDKTSMVPDFMVGESAFMKVCGRVTGLDKEHRKGPYVVEEIVSPENVRIQMPDSRKNPVVHVNHLKQDAYKEC